MCTHKLVKLIFHYIIFMTKRTYNAILQFQDEEEEKDLNFKVENDAGI